MLQSVRELERYSIQATDGKIGHIEELFFEDDTWIVRYLVVDVGNWLSNQRVLLIPSVVENVDAEARTVSVSLTKDQVENSPDVDTVQPISREKELKLHKYYDWEPYWTMPYPAALGTYPARPAAVGSVLPIERNETLESEPEPVAMVEESDVNSDLRSTDEVIDYAIQATDDHIGHVEDFIVDTQHWIIRYMVIDTRNWLPGKKVLVSPAWVSSIRWEDSEVHVELTRKQVKNSPEYDRETLDRDYETRLYEHYDKSVYW